MHPKYLLITALAVLCLAGCEKPDVPPEEKPVEATVQKITLTAEQIGTKTVIGAASGGTIPILWEASDEIWVRSAKQEAGTPGVRFTTSASGIINDGRVAQFSGEILDQGPYVAVYPYSSVAAASDNNSITIKVPQTQSYLKNSFGSNANISASSWASGTRTSFTSLAGSLRLCLKGYSSVRRIVLADKNPSFPLWGDCILTPGANGDFAVQWKNTAENRNEIILECGSDIPLSLTDATDFYVVVPEGAFAGGFTCTMYDADGKVVNTIDNDKSATVGKNSILPVEQQELVFQAGDGSESNPYQISTAAGLALMSDMCNGPLASSFIDKCYRQTADIDMTGIEFNSIGQTADKAFTGRYDGGGFKITNLSPKPADGKAAGMFGYLSGARVSNLTIEGYTNLGTNGEQGVIAGNAKNSSISNVHVNSDVHFVLCACGGIVGLMDGGSITDCSVSGYLHDEKYGDFQGVTVVSCVGGIVGCASKAEIRNCTFSGNVTAAGEQLGGIAGQVSECVIEKCKILAGSTVTGDNYYVGGIAGEMLKGGSISGCEVQAHVICWYPGAAGIVAWLQSGDISDCVVGSLAQVRTGQDKAGGIVAYIYHKDTAQTVNISNCTVYCNVAASYSVGGIVGECNPTNNNSKINIWNCAYVDGEIINAGYAASKWAMVGGLVAWARMGSTTAELNIVNCFSDPSVIRCDFPQPAEMDMGGFIGEQGGGVASVNIMGCYNTLAYGRAIINGKKDIPSQYYQYGSLIGNPNRTNLDHAYYIEGMQEMGKGNNGKMTDCEGLSVRQMTDGTMLDKLNAFVSSYTGPLQLKKWVAGASSFPQFEGITSNPSAGKKKKALRVSLIGDSLSTFDGYAPHGYQGSRAPNGYRCHYPTSDGNVTTAAQTYWYMLTYDYLSNAVWDTNLAFSGTATTRCTNTAYSDKYWYGQDFCTRYIENGGMGAPDIVIINGGANDWAHGIYNILGNQKLERYPSSTPHRPSDSAMNAAYAVADACKTLDEAKALPDATFVEAYLKLVRMISLQYPHVKIVVLIHDTLTPDVEESLLHIAAHYDNCKAVDLYAVNGFNDLGWNFEYLSKGYQPNMPKHDFDWSSIVKTGDLRQNCSDHYSAKAMKFIAEKIYTEIGAWLESSASYNEDGNGSISNFDNINGAW